ncbi:YqaJ viral recombinase family protein [Bacillus mycoides]|uniref:YqaJ viral recombinase family protein n=1 Tax=Bacillus mycoides TaxID=1405 RepID=UPI001F4703A2|nr:YqaJ viral recombinase family protein [Bacillus mycoides]MCQ6533391.1 YqaJ viral recombinase family protein [Bacillus mycoides]
MQKKFPSVRDLKVQRRNAILQHPEYPWMLANVDRLIVGEKISLECEKSPEYFGKE